MTCGCCGATLGPKGHCPFCDEPPREHRSEALAATLEAGRVVDHGRFDLAAWEAIIDSWLEEAVRWIQEAWTEEVLPGSGAEGGLDQPTAPPEVPSVSLDMVDTVRLSPPEHTATDGQLRASTVAALAAFRAR